MEHIVIDEKFLQTKEQFDRVMKQFYCNNIERMKKIIEQELNCEATIEGNKIILRMNKMFIEDELPNPEELYKFLKKMKRWY